MNEIYDWKTELGVLKEMLSAENERHEKEVAKLEDQAKKVIDLAGKDAKQAYEEWYNEAASIWFQIKDLLNWSEYWPWYVGGGLILFGLAMHYIFGL